MIGTGFIQLFDKDLNQSKSDSFSTSQSLSKYLNDQVSVLNTTVSQVATTLVASGGLTHKAVIGHIAFEKTVTQVVGEVLVVGVTASLIFLYIKLQLTVYQVKVAQVIFL